MNFIQHRSMPKAKRPCVFKNTTTTKKEIMIRQVLAYLQKRLFLQRPVLVFGGLGVFDDNCLCFNLNEGNGEADGYSSFSTYHSQGIPKTPSKNSYDFTQGAELEHIISQSFLLKYICFIALGSHYSTILNPTSTCNYSHVFIFATFAIILSYWSMFLCQSLRDFHFIILLTEL